MGNSDASPATARLTVRKPSQVYGLLVGLVAGMLLTGLGLPFIVGKPLTSTVAAGPTADGGAFEPLDAGATVDEGGEAAGTDTAAAAAAGPAAAAGGRAQGPGGIATGSPGAPVGTGQTASGETLTATDIGVTATEVKIANLVPDLGGLANAGFEVGAGDIEGQFRAYVNDINSRGGLAGRKLKVVYIKFDPLRVASMTAACLQATEQEKVFAVVNTGGFYGDPILCVAKDHKTPFIVGDGAPEEWYAESAGMLFSYTIGKTRSLLNYAGWMDANGLAKGKTIGLVDNEGAAPKLSVDAFKRYMDQLGYKIVAHETLSADPATAQSQIPVAIQNMRSKGVNLVLPVTNLIYATQFIQTAESQGWCPTYLTSDWAASAGDDWAARMPDCFNGTLGVTTTRVGESRAGIPEPAHQAACRAVYEKASGNPQTRDSADYGTTMYSCGLAQLVDRAGNLAGAQLTRARFSQALRSLGTFDLPGFAGASYGPSKFSAPDFERTVQWSAACKCYAPFKGSPFKRSRF